LHKLLIVGASANELDKVTLSVIDEFENFRPLLDKNVESLDALSVVTVDKFFPLLNLLLIVDLIILNRLLFTD
jgi:hypothetical protein